MVLIAIDPVAVAGSLSEIVANLPAIFAYLEAAVYIFMVLFLGSIVVLGLRVYVPFWKRLAVRIVFGILAVFSGIALKGLMPLPDNIIIRMFQIDLIVSGIFASIIYMAALLLVSRSLSSEETIRRAIEKLNESMKREHARGKPGPPLRNPYFIAAIIIIAALIVASVLSYQGQPSMQESILSELGISSEDLASIGDMVSGLEGSELPPELLQMSSSCISAMSSLGAKEELYQAGLENYVNDGLKSEIERESGLGITVMQRSEVDGIPIVIGVATDGSICYATESEFCICP